ncbi:hypothetical protein [Prochlorococcus sp. MIT 1300]|uniref:hypothetical protein n=1 Tax=Prochlorococcus sp. MIT 1300 TaxID=3096218 RepID=UPI002A756EA1|nr:hypothetical protein [Prochlorococcus sp. MIT 1300]
MRATDERDIATVHACADEIYENVDWNTFVQDQVKQKTDLNQIRSASMQLDL